MLDDWCEETGKVPKILLHFVVLQPQWLRSTSGRKAKHLQFAFSTHHLYLTCQTPTISHWPGTLQTHSIVSSRGQPVLRIPTNPVWVSWGEAPAPLISPQDLPRTAVTTIVKMLHLTTHYFLLPLSQPPGLERALHCPWVSSRVLPPGVSASKYTRTVSMQTK